MHRHLILGLFAIFLTCQGCVGRLFYQPDHKVYQNPASRGLEYQEVSFPSTDGVQLSGWFIPSIGTPKGTVIHFHGNAENMTSHFNFVSWLAREGFNLFVFDYRGYGKSTGTPTRKGLYDDCLAALDYLAQRQDVAPSRLIVFGQSLGGTNAIAALGSTKMRGVRAVAIESAFSSYRSIVREKIALVPVLSILKWPLSYLLIGDSYSAITSVANISPIPLLFIYETEDRIVPISEGIKLYNEARPPKDFLVVDGDMHAGAFYLQNSPHRERLVRFFENALGPTPEAASQAVR